MQDEVFVDHMIMLCESQVLIWEAIHNKSIGTGAKATKEQSEKLQTLIDEFKVPLKFTTSRPTSAASAGTSARSQPTSQPVSRPSTRERLRRLRAAAGDIGRRAAHVAQIVLALVVLKAKMPLIIAASIYSTLVLLGFSFNRLIDGLTPRGRPALDAVLGRMRVRAAAMETLKQGIVRIEELDEREQDQLRKAEEFLLTQQTRVSAIWRVLYQLFVMFFLTMMPNCYPHPEMIK